MESIREQFAKIYEQYIDKIYRFVYLRVDSQEVAEDITSRVFLKSWGAFQANPASIVNINAFLYQISRNMIVDHYREKARTKVVPTEHAAHLADIRVDIHHAAVINAEMETVKAAIQNIKKEYQDVLIWHYLEDMSSQEIGSILEKSPGAVRVMIHRGLQALKGVLES